jgi:glycosyltransferase involved in cell wall biosynthesis
MKTIALFDNSSGAHHITYLRLFSQTLLEIGFTVMTFCREPDEVSNWIYLHCSEKFDNFHIFKVQEVKAPVLPIVGELPRTFMVIAQWQYAAKVIQQTALKIGKNPDLVFFAWLDDYLSDYLTHHIIDRIFPFKWSGLYFTPPYLKFGQRTLPVVRIPLTPYAIAKSPSCRGIAFLDDNVTRSVQMQIKTPAITFPDVTDESLPDNSSAVIKEIRKKAGKRRIVGLLGGLTKRKGLLTLLEVAQKSVSENWFFVFIGKLYEHELLPDEAIKVRNIVKADPSNCFFHFERIPDEAQFNAAIDICDILFAAYENFPFSSNILTKAAVFQKPLIVSDGFCMSERVKAFRLGVSIPERDVTKCIEALNYLSKELDSDTSILKPDFEGYKRIHSAEQLRTAFETICNSTDV